MIAIHAETAYTVCACVVNKGAMLKEECGETTEDCWCALPAVKEIGTRFHSV